MKICFRADGGSKIGLGHIMRTLVLAEEFKGQGCEVIYACKNDEARPHLYKAGIDKIIEQGFKVILLNEKRYLEELSNIKSDCIITDSYNVDQKYFSLVKKYFKFSGYIDDNVICDYFDVDFLINQNIYATGLTYKVNDETLLLLGGDYVLLRKEFQNISPMKVNKKLKNVMITIGGSDNGNLTEKIILNLQDEDEIIFHVVITNAFKYRDALKKYEGKNIVFHNSPIMSELMMSSDAAISACGSTLYELAVCGIPTIGLVTAENQENLSKAMDKLGVIKHSAIDDIRENIMLFDYKKRKDMNLAGRKYIDGLGSRRVVKKVLSNIQDNL